jgi:hypothetical protein
MITDKVMAIKAPLRPNRGDHPLRIRLIKDILLKLYTFVVCVDNVIIGILDGLAKWTKPRIAFTILFLPDTYIL